MTISQWIDAAIAASQADGCVVIVEATDQLNLRWAANSLTTNGQMTATPATVISVRGKASGQASGPVTGQDDLLSLVREADAAAEAAPDSEDAAELVKGEREEGFDLAPDTIEVSAFERLTRELGEAFAEARRDGHLLFGFAEYQRTTTYLATSGGLRRRFVQPMGRFEFTAKGPDMVNSSWVGQATKDFTDVDVPAHHAELMRRLSWGETRIDLPAGRYETILSPGAVVDLMYPMTWDFTLRDALEGRSAFSGAGERSTKIGQRLSSLPVSVTTDPATPGLETAPFAIVHSSQPGATSVFDNGMPVERVDWIRDGELRDLAATRAVMAQEKLDGPLRFLADNLTIDAGGTVTLEEMIASTKRGLLVTCLWYIRTVDPQTLLLTGLTRDGVYLVEDGEVKGLVNNFRYNESPLDLLGRVTEVSKAEPCLCREWNDWFTRSVAPAMRIPDFTMSTVSQAY